jgi:hypothetical protein
VGGIDRCVSEFIRITDQLLPERVFTRVMPELRTAAARRPARRCARSCWAPTRLPGRQRRRLAERWAPRAST